jgi:hypothetical protein
MYPAVMQSATEDAIRYYQFLDAVAAALQYHVQALTPRFMWATSISAHELDLACKLSERLAPIKPWTYMVYSDDHRSHSPNTIADIVETARLETVVLFISDTRIGSDLAKFVKDLVDLGCPTVHE